MLKDNTERQKTNKFLVGACRLKTYAVMTSCHFCHPSQGLQMRVILNFFTFLTELYTHESRQTYPELETEMAVKI